MDGIDMTWKEGYITGTTTDDQICFCFDVVHYQALMNGTIDRALSAIAS